MEYELPNNTFWSDFSIADRFGYRAIRDTYKRSQHYISDPGMYAALVVTLNHKIWSHHEGGDVATARVYNELWAEAHDRALETFTGDDARLYFKLTD